MAIKIAGNSGPIVEVDASNNLQVNLPVDATKSGFVRIQSTDGGDIDTTEDNALRTSATALIHYDQIEGSSVNINLWNPFDVSGMTIVQASGFITLNAAGVTTASAYASLKSNKVIPLYGSIPFRSKVTAKVIGFPQANATGRIGFGTNSAGSTPTDGAYFEWDPAGGFYAKINNGGSITASVNLAGTTHTDNAGDSITLPPSTIANHLYEIEVVEDHVQFFIDDILISDVQVPSGLAFPFNAGRQQIFASVINGGSAPATFPQISIGQTISNYEDVQQNRPWGEILSGLGRGAYQLPISAFTQNANHANSTSPASATLSNTAAGYTTLGGRFQFAAVAAAATDFALFAFQVPAGFQMFITSISISTGVTGVAVVTPTILDWALGINSSAVSLATADGTNTWAPRRIPLGAQGFIASAGIAQMASDLTRRFEVPLVVDSGRFFHVIMQVPNGAATASLIFRGDVLVNGYFE